MKSVVIFSGTTEGRELSLMLTKEGLFHHVCVAGEYGKDVMHGDTKAKVHVGRLDAWGMKDFFSKEGMEGDSIVVDATHPYAAEVTENIKKAAGDMGFRYVRVVRKTEGAASDGAFEYKDMEECAAALDKTKGNILLTTGSKDLGKYCRTVSSDTRDRTYVRVLPSIESLKICKDEKIESGHVIAMHGPFDASLNKALIRQYDIRHLVTKESGTAGGFREKLRAAAETGTELHIIARPSLEEGLSVEETFCLITGKEAEPFEAPLNIVIAGMGMGSEKNMTVEVKEAIERCDSVFGAERLICNLPCHHKYSMYKATDIIPILETEKPASAVIVFSGDTGFYSGAKKMIKELKVWKKDVDVTVLPGISSFSYLAAALGESLDDSRLFSLHGKDTERDFFELTEEVKVNSKVFTLLSGAKTVREIARRLDKCGIIGRIYVGRNLSYEDEKIEEMSFEKAVEYDEKGVVTALICNDDPAKRPLINVKKDADFIRDKIPMTKEVIRHESIIRLDLKEGDILYDIGGGTGSVAIEAAGLHPSLQVTTIEKKHEAVELIKKNLEKTGLCNVNVLEGEAPEILEELERPDCVFIGGSGGNLSDMVELLHKKGSGIRFVITAVSLETVNEVQELLKKYAPYEEETVMITVSDVHFVGSHHMMQGQNPVWIFSFTL
ncbi:MAG: precorrin-6A reductase [Butyrivibrio sp.]|nr:precorrin-6A reductase [Butyrivibrio sp.]